MHNNNNNSSASTIEVGDAVLSIDGIPVHDATDATVDSLLQGPAGSVLPLTLRRPDGSEYVVNVHRHVPCANDSLPIILPLSALKDRIITPRRPSLAKAAGGGDRNNNAATAEARNAPALGTAPNVPARAPPRSAESNATPLPLAANASSVPLRSIVPLDVSETAPWTVVSCKGVVCADERDAPRTGDVFVRVQGISVDAVGGASGIRRLLVGPHGEYVDVVLARDEEVVQHRLMCCSGHPAFVLSADAPHEVVEVRLCVCLCVCVCVCGIDSCAAPGILQLC
jgi:hypothetical protein